jgi:TolB-like protein
MSYFLAFLLLPFEETCPPVRKKPKLAVFELQQIGVEKELVTIVSDLLRIELSECPNYRVISKEVMILVLGDTLTVKDMDDVKTKSDSLKAKLAVTGHITQLGTKIIVSVSLISVRDKVAIFNDKLTSSNIEDLELVIKRLADALCTMEKAKTRVTVETITEEEAKPKRRRASYHTAGLLLGYMFPLGGSYGKDIERRRYYYWNTDYERFLLKKPGNIASMPGWNITYFYEMPYYIAEMCGRMYRKKSAFFINIIFSGYKFLSLQDFAPFVGGGIGMGWGNKVTSVDSSYEVSYNQDTTWYYYSGKEEGFNGLVVEIGGGLVVFRTYDFHFILSLKYHIMFAEGTPNGFIINFGVSYKKGKEGCCGL